MTRISDTPAPHGTTRKPGIRLDFVSDPDSVTNLPDAFIARAKRGVAGRARDTADARLLLDVLGLLPTPTPPEATS